MTKQPCSLAHKAVDFIIKKPQENIVWSARNIGYVIIDTKENGEYNLVRRLGRDNYPRFHAYVAQRGVSFEFSLHLDQKAPIYKGIGVHAHNGEYFGPLIEEEAERIKNILETK